MDIALKDAHDVALRASRRASEHLMNRFSEGSRNVLNDSRHDVKLEVSSVEGELRGAPAQTFTFKLIVPSSVMFMTGEFYAIIIVIIVLIIGLFWYRRKKKKKLND